jgi:hypothetical protein
MHLTGRSFILPLVGILTLLCTACSSKNEGKIVGKWKVQSGSGMDAKDLKSFEENKIYFVFDFKADKSLTIGLEATDSKSQATLASLSQGKTTSFNMKYRLRSGDAVEFYDLPKEMTEKGSGFIGKNKDLAKTHIMINGDNMIMTDDDGKTGNLVRMK